MKSLFALTTRNVIQHSLVHSLFVAGTLLFASLQTAQAVPLTWHGGSGNPTFWDIGTTPNWNSSTTTFANGDAVTFDGTAVGYTVNVQTAVSPVSMAISSSGSAYTFNGSAIAGATSIVKTGTAKATFTQSSLTFGGGTQLNSASTVEYAPTSGTSHSFGTGTIELNTAGAFFDYNPATAGSTLSNNFLITANGVQWRSPTNLANIYGGTVTLGADISIGSHPETRGKLRESVVLTGDRTISGSGFSPVPVISGQVTSSGPKRTITINNTGDNPGWFVEISSPTVGGWDVQNIVHNPTAGAREATLRVNDDEREFFDNMEANGGYLKNLASGVQFARTAVAEIGFDIILNTQSAGAGAAIGSGIRGNSAFDVVSGGGLHGNGIYRSGVPGCCTGSQPYNNPLDVNVSGTGMISPGDPTAVNTAGILTINGDVVFAGGQLRIDVVNGSGIAGTSFDRLIVQDAPAAGSDGAVTGISTASLIVDFHNVSFDDLQGDVLTILTSSLTNFTGQQFASVTTLNTSDYFVNVVYGAGFIQLALVSTVPEPSSLTLLGLGLVGAAVARRRRQRVAA